MTSDYATRNSRPASLPAGNYSQTERPAYPQNRTAGRSTSGQRCRISAFRDQATGKFYALPHEYRVALKKHCKTIISNLQPANHRERWHATSITEDQWRLPMFKLNPRPYPRKAGLRGFTPGQRARALENDISALGMSSPTIDIDAGSPEAAVSRARVWLADGQKLEMLASHESRIRRGIGKSEEQLKECQAERKATCNQALEEAKLLAPLAIAEGEIYGQKENGFGFSNGEIVRLVRRDMRFQEAARLKEHGRQRPVQTPKAA